MQNFKELHDKWRGFAAERARARREVDASIDKNNNEIERLRLENIELNKEFQEKWTKAKKDLQEARDRAVMDAMAGPEGRSGQDILRELGSRNTVWIYDLRKRLAAEGRLPESVNENSPIELLRRAAQPEPEPKTLGQVPADVVWLSHDHHGVVGWLISADYKLIKSYATEGALKNEWFVCSAADYEFLAGSSDLYKATPKNEIVRKVNLLKSILDDTYGGTLKLVDNPYIE